MLRSAQRARLYINGVDVGAVTVKGWKGAWGIGDFRAADGFSAFSPKFCHWSRLMHADSDADRVSEAALAELRRIECEIDALRAELLLTDTGDRRRIRQLNIDGPLIEWKEDVDPGAASPAPHT